MQELSTSPFSRILSVGCSDGFFGRRTGPARRRSKSSLVGPFFNAVNGSAQRGRRTDDLRPVLRLSVPNKYFHLADREVIGSHRKVGRPAQLGLVGRNRLDRAQEIRHAPAYAAVREIQYPALAVLSILRS
jgi:hypothetical protein